MENVDLRLADVALGSFWMKFGAQLVFFFGGKIQGFRWNQGISWKISWNIMEDIMEFLGEYPGIKTIGIYHGIGCIWLRIKDSYIVVNRGLMGQYRTSNTLH